MKALCHSPKVGTAAAQDVLVSIELNPIDLDDHITQFALKTQFIENGAGHCTHFSLHEAALELRRRGWLLQFTHVCSLSYTTQT